MRIDERTINRATPAYVIAEIGHNHQGNLETAKELIIAAKYAGASAVKFQKRNNRSLYTDSFFDKPYASENSYAPTYGLHREFLEFNHDQFKVLVDFCKTLGITFLCTPFDCDSVDFLEDFDVPGYKIASGDITNIQLIKYVAKLQKPMFLSTGACEERELEIAEQVLNEYNPGNYCLLHCVAQYPAKDRNLNLKIIEHFLRIFPPNVVIGYSSHDLGKLAPTVAYLLGATVIEKHFTINRAWKGTDHKMSLEADDLRKLIRDLRRLDEMLGTDKKKLNDYELPARQLMGKSIYVSAPISAGEEFSPNNICLKTPADPKGLSPLWLPIVLSGKSRQSLSEGELVLRSHVEKTDE